MEVIYFILFYIVVIYRVGGNIDVGVNLLLSSYRGKEYGVSFMAIVVFDTLTVLISVLLTYRAKFDMMVLMYGLLLLFMSILFIFVAIFLAIRNDKKQN